MEETKTKVAKMSELIKKWRENGGSKKSFCATEGINIHTFTYWLEKERLGAKGGGFIELKADRDSSYIELLFPHGAVLRIREGISGSEFSMIKKLIY